eukprot:TRINITY_DN303_c0_g1_i1.p2 TRINITY_DN303_c0_g1~~TRINITY_DN303_c0_g1_i1.p2  ORF type:complete len:168 (-),score=40.80 TRINITY_DN303_c0_g1_i1:321-824(-)
MTDSSAAALHLQRQLRELSKNPVNGFSAGADDNIFEWDVLLEGPADTLYEGGYFKAKMVFPNDYPNSPPTFSFQPHGLWHPNVYWDTGAVCISILHAGEDDTGYEDASLRWSPLHTVESIVLSIQSMLSDINDESPANLDAAIEFRNDPDSYKKKVRRCVRRSIEDL